MVYKRKNVGVCSRSTEVELAEDGTILNCHQEGGCSGNIQGVEQLVRGQKAQDVIERLSGIRCGFKASSCPDQLAVTLREALAQQGK